MVRSFNPCFSGISSGRWLMHDKMDLFCVSILVFLEFRLGAARRSFPVYPF